MTIGQQTHSSLPNFPLQCLKTANDLTTGEVVRGQKTVIDFWTTKCTNCPQALDKLDTIAQDPKYSNIRFVSICCDKLDGAREIIEEEEEPRWPRVDHYFMPYQEKERAKKILGFKTVPFYVVVNENGEIEQCNKHVDFETLGETAKDEEEKKEEEPPIQEKPMQVERVFNMDDLDF